MTSPATLGQRLAALATTATCTLTGDHEAAVVTDGRRIHVHATSPHPSLPMVNVERDRTVLVMPCPYACACGSSDCDDQCDGDLTLDLTEQRWTADPATVALLASDEAVPVQA